MDRQNSSIWVLKEIVLWCLPRERGRKGDSSMQMGRKTGAILGSIMWDSFVFIMMLLRCLASLGGFSLLIVIIQFVLGF